MAVVVESFPQSTAGGRRKYPWDQWQDGKIWKAESGVDFELPPNQFRSVLHNRATDTGSRCRTKIDGKFVVFQFTKKEAKATEGGQVAADSTE